MKVKSYLTSLIDFPDYTSTIMFTIGCNYRCPYCSNYELFDENQSYIHEVELLSILQRRVKICNKITLSGGEPTIQEGLVEFLKDLKTMGYGIKLDTNGSNPDILKKCMPYLDYVALDIKTDLSRYPFLFFNFNPKKLQDSISLIKKGDLPYEFRTVMCPSLVELDNFDDILKLIGECKTYRLLQFYPEKCYMDAYTKLTPYTKEVLELFKRKAIESKCIESVIL